MSSASSEIGSKSLVDLFARWKNICIETNSLSKKEELRAESKALFSTIFRTTEIVSPDNVVLKTKSSHNEALARLIHELGPALSNGTHASRITALHCLCGAIEGSNDNVLSQNILNLLGNFLVGHCGPIEEEDEGDSDEAVRDAALLCLSALVRGKVDCDSGDATSTCQHISLRMHLARKGVEQRCAVPETDGMDYDHGYDFPSSNDVRGGLSTLPRSRRALCFDLVRAAIDGLATVSREPLTEKLAVNIMAEFVQFTSFAANCLHGESDPRCLVQLLEMLHALQLTFLPFFQANNSASVKFPSLSIFDAVAPYYPIQFTPPPNDVHGITRSGLHHALMDVLCFTGFDSLASDRDTMLNLTTGIFLERLMPLDNEDGSSPSLLEDKIDAIMDLTMLLFPPRGSVCDLLHDEIVRDLSSALIAVHATGASGVGSGGDNGRRHKEMADACRTLVSKIALSMEVCDRNVVWEIFVMEAVKEHSPILSSSPQSMQGRTSTAYLACLSGSGGPRTLRACLTSCVPPLLDVLSNDTNDEEKVAAAAYGIGAFFSSVQVAFERAKTDKIALHPHPLEAFSTKTIRALCEILIIPSDTDIVSLNNTAVQTSTRIAAICAMESVLAVTPSALLDKTDMRKIRLILESIAALLEIPCDSTNLDGSIDLRKSGTRMLGWVLGRSFDEMASDSIPCYILDENNEIRSSMQEMIFPKLLLSCTRVQAGWTKTPRFDWMVLAYACEISHSAANHIIASLVNLLHEALHQDFDASIDERHAIPCARAFAYVVRKGGGAAAAAFHDLVEPQITPMHIVMSLLPDFSKETQRSGIPDRTLQTSMSNLMLPSTSEERANIDRLTNYAYQILQFLLPAYQYALPERQLEILVKHVSHVLPPLSEWENAQLCISLPLLSAALLHSDPTPNKSGVDSKLVALGATLIPMASCLTDYALAADDVRARSAAASCVYSIIKKFQGLDSKDCVSREVLRDSIFPSISVGSEPTESGRIVVALRDSFNLAALVGSAAACRGRSSSSIADEVALFFIQLSCHGKAYIPIIDSRTMVSLSGFPTDGNGMEARLEAERFLTAASAFGAMIGIEDGGPFWKQRLVHMATKEVLIASARESATLAEVSPREVGQLILACHIVASINIRALSESTLIDLTDLILRGLVRIHSTACFSQSQIMSVNELIIASVMKLMSLARNTMVKYIVTVIHSCLRVLDSDDTADPARDLPIKLLALQGLLNATTFFAECKEGLLASKPAVESILSSAIEHPSLLLRQAAIEVRNAWSIMA